MVNDCFWDISQYHKTKLQHSDLETIIFRERGARFAWTRICDITEILGIDQQKLLATVKAIRRWEAKRDKVCSPISPIRQHQSQLRNFLGL
jgi:hypothetical protein